MGRLKKNGARQHSQVVFATNFIPAGLHVPHNTDSINTSQSVSRIMMLHQWTATFSLRAVPQFINSACPGVRLDSRQRDALENRR